MSILFCAVVFPAKIAMHDAVMNTPMTKAPPSIYGLHDCSTESDSWTVAVGAGATSVGEVHLLTSSTGRVGWSLIVHSNLLYGIFYSIHRNNSSSGHKFFSEVPRSHSLSLHAQKQKFMESHHLFSTFLTKRLIMSYSRYNLSY